MAPRPRHLSRSPEALDLQDPRADVLADVLAATLMRNVLYRRLEFRAPWGIRVPDKERTAFYLVARGSALVEVDGEAARTVSAGDVVFVPRGTGHVLRDSARTRPQAVCDGPHRDSPTRVLGGEGAPTSIVAGFFEFGGGKRPVLLEGMPALVVLGPSEPGYSSSIATTMQLLLAESAAPGPASALVLGRLVDVLFVQTLRLLASTPACRQRGLAALADPPIAEALAVLHARVDEPWTVARLAARVGLSRSGFAARFTELVGEPPLSYLARWRMARAAEMLRGTGDGVADIAARVGYQSVPSFNKAFKKWQGTSPGRFRALSPTPPAG